jgi:carboxypeptidase family protein
MKPYGTIRGIVKDDFDEPVEDINVVIITGPSHPDVAPTTSSDGTFDFGNLQPGNYIIQAYGNNVESDPIPVRVNSRKVAFVEIWVETGTVEDDNVVNELD